ncbi:MAG: T9SS type A sorting domain-containing protein [Bacteroidia bacterium]
MGLGQVFSDFTWNYTTQTAAVNLAGQLTTTTIGRDFTVLSTGTGTVTLKTSAGALTTTIGRNFLISGGTVILTDGAVGNFNSNLTFNIQGTYTQTGGTFIIAANTGALSTTNGWGAVTIAGTTAISGGVLTFTTSTSSNSSQGYGTFTSTGAMTVSGGVINLSASSGGGSGGYGSLTASSTLTISGGTINLSSSTRTGGGGNGTMNVSGLLTLSGTGVINGSTSTGALTTGCNGTINANAGFTMTGGTLDLTKTTSTGGASNGIFNITGACAISGGTLIVNSSSAPGTTGATGTVTITGTLAISGTATVNLTSSSTTGGSPAGNGTISVSSSFTMTGGALNLSSGSGIGTGTDGLLDITGSASFTGGTVNLTSSARTGGGGNGTINVAGASFSHTTSAASFTKTGSAAVTGTVNIDGIVAQTIQSTNGFSGSPIVFNISESGASVAKCTVPAGVTFLVNSGTTLNLNDNSLNSGYDLQVIATGVLKVSGTMNVNSLATLDLLTYVITDASTGAGTFNLNSDALLMTQHAQGIAKLSSGALGCIQVTGGRYYSSDASYTYYGTVAQVTGDGLPVSLTNPAALLTINNSSATTTSGVTLTQATITVGGLVLTKGRFITTSTSLFTLDNGATSSIGSILSFVDGPIKKIGFTAGVEFVYPTGDLYTATGAVPTVKWARIGVIASSASSTDAFIAEYVKINDNCTTPVISSVYGPGINHVSYKEYWNLTSAAGTATPTVKLYWENNSSSSAVSVGSAISSPIAADLHVAEFDAAQWNDRGVGAITTAGITGTITSGIATTFTTGTAMPFTFSGPTVVNPLPIELLTFTGANNTDGNLLNWATATEINNNYFDLERSSNANDFTKIVTINGAGNSTSSKEYNYLDSSPAQGINYYRLKQVDYNGDHTYSNVIAIDNDYNNTTIQVYPNPSNDIVNIITPNNITLITIYNTMGEIVYSSSSVYNNSIQFKPLAYGVYVVKTLDTNGKTSMSRFVKN